MNGGCGQATMMAPKPAQTGTLTVCFSFTANPIGPIFA